MSDKRLLVLDDELRTLQERLAVRTAELDQTRKALEDEHRTLMALRARARKPARLPRYLVERRLRVLVTVEVLLSLVGLAVFVMAAGARSAALAILLGGIATVAGWVVAHRMVGDAMVREPDAHEALATALADTVVGPEKFERKLRHAEWLAELILESPSGDSLAVYRAMNQLAMEWRHVEQTRPTTPSERLGRRVEITALRARALHRAGESRRALSEAIAAYTAIENYAGGRERMLDRLGSSDRVVTESLLRILASLAPALSEEAPPPSASGEYWLGELRDIVDRLLPQFDGQPTETEPLGSSLVQVLYLLCEQSDPADAQRIAALRRLDAALRPGDAGKARQLMYKEQARVVEHDFGMSASAAIPSFVNGFWS